jgi:hypothetical protein
MRCPSSPRLSSGILTAGVSECPPTPSCVMRLNAGWSRIHAMVDVATLVFHVWRNCLLASVGRKCSTPVLKLTCAHPLRSRLSFGTSMQSVLTSASAKAYVPVLKYSRGSLSHTTSASVRIGLTPSCSGASRICKQTLKPVFHFTGSRVETGRFQAMSQLDSSCTAPPSSSRSWMNLVLTVPIFLKLPSPALMKLAPRPGSQGCTHTHSGGCHCISYIARTIPAVIS